MEWLLKKKWTVRDVLTICSCYCETVIGVYDRPSAHERKATTQYNPVSSVYYLPHVSEGDEDGYVVSLDHSIPVTMSRQFLHLSSN